MTGIEAQQQQKSFIVGWKVNLKKCGVLCWFWFRKQRHRKIDPLGAFDNEPKK